MEIFLNSVQLHLKHLEHSITYLLVFGKLRLKLFQASKQNTQLKLDAKMNKKLTNNQ